MSRRVLVGFVFVNIIVSLAVAVVVFSIYDRSLRPECEPAEGPTQIVILTATPEPGYDLRPMEYLGTIDAQQLTVNALEASAQIVAVVTATPDPASAGIAVPETTAVATIPPELLPSVPTDLPPGEPTATLPSDGCVRHIVQSGEVIISIANDYDVLPGDLLTANGMTVDDAAYLQVGDVLLIPVPGCNILNTPTPQPEATNTPFELTRVVPTVTLPPTAVNAQIIIEDVLFWGDVNNEAVELRNLGNVINLQGWTLANERGDVFRFPEARMQQGSLVRIYTRQGQNTPAALYWGQEAPTWQEGDTIILSDASGQVQATFVVGTNTP